MKLPEQAATCGTYTVDNAVLSGLRALPVAQLDVPATSLATRVLLPG
jgi:hypothetical protein